LNQRERLVPHRFTSADAGQLVPKCIPETAQQQQKSPAMQPGFFTPGKTYRTQMLSPFMLYGCRPGSSAHGAQLYQGA
jgi:hypothetical protein